MLNDVKQYLVMTISTVRDSCVSALHDGRVGMTVGISTFLAGLTKNDVASYIGIAVSLTVMTATIINVHLSIKKSRRDDAAATLKNEIDRAKLRAIKKAEELGKTPQRETD